MSKPYLLDKVSNTLKGQKVSRAKASSFLNPHVRKHIFLTRFNSHISYPSTPKMNWAEEKPSIFSGKKTDICEKSFTYYEKLFILNSLFVFTSTKECTNASSSESCYHHLFLLLPQFLFKAGVFPILVKTKTSIPPKTNKTATKPAPKTAKQPNKTIKKNPQQTNQKKKGLQPARRWRLF